MQRRTDMTFREVEEEVLDGVLVLGRAEMRMKTGKRKACFERAKEGFVHLLGDYEGALEYYQKALRVEKRSWARHILTLFRPS